MATDELCRRTAVITRHVCDGSILMLIISISASNATAPKRRRNAPAHVFRAVHAVHAAERRNPACHNYRPLPPDTAPCLLDNQSKITPPTHTQYSHLIIFSWDSDNHGVFGGFKEFQIQVACRFFFFFIASLKLYSEFTRFNNNEVTMICPPVTAEHKYVCKWRAQVIL